nr:hypothetical protein [Streptomyces sp. SA15]
MAAHQQDLDQGPGAVPLAVGGLRSLPPGIVNRRELPCGTGLFEGGGSGKRAGLADQGFQVVVQIQPGLPLGDQPFMTSDLLLAVVDHQLRGMQHRPDRPPDQPHRHRIAVGADTDLAEAIHPQAEQPPCLEGFVR